MVLRSDLTLAFFSADRFVRVGLVKTATQQVRVLPKRPDRHCGVLEGRTNPDIMIDFNSLFMVAIRYCAGCVYHQTYILFI